MTAADSHDAGRCRLSGPKHLPPVGPREITQFHIVEQVVAKKDHSAKRTDIARGDLQSNQYAKDDHTAANSPDHLQQEKMEPGVQKKSKADHRELQQDQPQPPFDQKGALLA